MGPTGGYLVAFLLAAGAVGWVAELGYLRRFRTAVVVMIVGHLFILTLGWFRLARTLGLGLAYREGVAPFMASGIAKSVIAALIVSLQARWGSQPSWRRS